MAFLIINTGGDGELNDNNNTINDPVNGVGDGIDVDGTANDDDLFGSIGDDTIDGFAGNDSLRGFADDDILNGNAGDDTLNGGAGSDTLNGGDFGTNFDIATFEDNTAGVTVSLATGEATSGADIDELNGIEGVFGSDSDDVITGDPNDNELRGNGGNDTLNGERGEDTIEGGDGDDALNGGDDNDTLLGSLGDDTLNGGAGNDLVDYRELGLSVSIGQLGVISKGVNTAIGDDTAEGGADTLAGTGANQQIPTIERIIGAPNVTNEINADNADLGGTFNIDLDNDDGGAGTAGTVEIEGLGASFTIFNFDNVFGTANGDTIEGDAGPNFINGLDGNDSIDGRFGDDTLQGWTGNDTIDGSAGDDSIDAGTGADTIIGSGGDSVTGSDDVLTYEGFGEQVQLVQLGGINKPDSGEQDQLVGLAPNGGDPSIDVIIGDPDPAFSEAGPRGTVNEIDVTIPNTSGIFGSSPVVNAAINVDLSENELEVVGIGQFEVQNFVNVFGNLGDDTIVGNDLSNRLGGGDGDDSINGGLGNDLADGGDGIDTVFFDRNGSGIDIDLNDETFPNSTGQGSDRYLNFENVDGTDDNDSIRGDEDGQLLRSFDGNDRVFARAGDDTIEAGAGNDSVGGGTGNDDIDAGTGADTIIGSQGSDTINGGDTLPGDVLDYDSLGGLGGPVRLAQIGAIDKSSGQDQLVGFGSNQATPSIDVIIGDSTFGVPGPRGTVNEIDVTIPNAVLGGLPVAGLPDITVDLSNNFLNIPGVGDFDIQNFVNIFSGGGDDSLTGDNLGNIIDGNAGNDTIDSGAGPDTITAGAGDDVINGQDGFDSIDGGTGADTILGSAGNDTISGGDTLPGDVLDYTNLNGPVRLAQIGAIDKSGGQQDQLVGFGASQAIPTIDVIIGNPAFGGEGARGTVNEIDVTIPNAVFGGLPVAGLPNITVDLSNNFLNIPGVGDFDIQNFVNIFSGGGDDTLTGNNLGNIIGGAGGNDSIDGAEGNDRLFGSGGDDTLNGGLGDDTIDGGAGFNTVTFNPNGGAINLTAGVVTGQGTDTLTSIRGVIATNGDDTLNDGSGSDRLEGLAGDDTINGNDGDDTILGGAGNDEIDGGAGADSIDGGAGDDSLEGGNGFDTIIATDGNDTVSGGNGSDQITVGGTTQNIVINEADNDFDSTLSPTISDTIIGFNTADSDQDLDIVGELVNFTQATSGPPPAPGTNFPLGGNTPSFGFGDEYVEEDDGDLTDTFSDGAFIFEFTVGGVLGAIGSISEGDFLNAASNASLPFLIGATGPAQSGLFIAYDTNASAIAPDPADAGLFFFENPMSFTLTATLEDVGADNLSPDNFLL